jgi:hypothetical protein
LKFKSSFGHRDGPILVNEYPFLSNITLYLHHSPASASFYG